MRPILTAATPQAPPISRSRAGGRSPSGCGSRTPETICRSAETSSQSLGCLAVSLFIALWSVSNLTQAMFAALNIAYEEPERRSLLRFYLSAFTFAMLGILSGVLMLLALSTCRSCSPMPAIRRRSRR